MMTKDKKDKHYINSALIEMIKENQNAAKKIQDVYLEKMEMIKQSEERLVKMYLRLQGLSENSEIKQDENGHFYIDIS